MSVAERETRIPTCSRHVHDWGSLISVVDGKSTGGHFVGVGANRTNGPDEVGLINNGVGVIVNGSTATGTFDDVYLSFKDMNSIVGEMFFYSFPTPVNIVCGKRKLTALARREVFSIFVRKCWKIFSVALSLLAISDVVAGDLSSLPLTTSMRLLSWRMIKEIL